MKKTTYLSEEKNKELKKELEDRKTTTRAEIGNRLLRAKEMGDLSENADYHIAKKDFADNEGRIFQLEEILGSVLILKDGDNKSDNIVVGSKIKVLVDSKEEREYKIVGPFDSDPTKGFISYESPLGKEFLGHREGKEVEFKLPNKEVKKYKILEIK